MIENRRKNGRIISKFSELFMLTNERKQSGNTADFRFEMRPDWRGKTNRLHPIFDDKEAGNRPVTVRFPASLLASGAEEGRSQLQSIPYA